MMFAGLAAILSRYHPAMIDPIQRHVTTPFGKLSSLQWGHHDAPPLLALHGWLDNAASFSRVAPLLATGHRVVALDLPGHGRSEHAPAAVRRYHVADQVEHVLDAADALGLENFDLLGHSLGAGIASLLAAAYPERVRKLVLIEGLGPLADEGSTTLTRWRKAHARRTRTQRPARIFRCIDDAVAARVAAGDLDAAEVAPIVQRNLREVDGGHAWRSDARLRSTTPIRIAETQVRALLAGIDAATLLFLATPATAYLPGDMMQARAGCVADIDTVCLAGPHHLHIRHPREVAARVQAFLTA